MPKTITATPPTLPSATEIANLPLLVPFRSVTSPNPESRPLIQALLAEQEVANIVEIYQNHEDTLRDKLAKIINDAEREAKGLTKKDSSKDDNNEGGAGSNTNAADGNNNRNNSLVSTQSSSKNKKKDKVKLSPENQKKIKDLEKEIRENDKVCSQYKNELLVRTVHTRGLFQAEYTKIGMRLEVQNNSPAITALEESFAFFCPRTTVTTPVLTDGSGGEEIYDDSQRVAYVREMCPLLRDNKRQSSVALFALPYVKKFQCTPESNPTLVLALLEEVYQTGITNELRTKLKDDKLPTSRLLAGARMKVLRYCEEQQEKRIETTTDLVRKHYRKKSIKLHPDRNGEEMRPVFEEFTDARNVFSDVALRQSYVIEMSEVYNRVGESVIETAHVAWNNKHRPDVAEQNNMKQGNKKGKNNKDAPLQIEGTLDLTQSPKGVMVTTYRSGGDYVKISVHALQPRYEFYSKIASIHVEARHQHHQVRKFILGRHQIVKNLTLDHHRQPILEGLITVAETSLNPGRWEIVATYRLCTMGSDPMNPDVASDEIISTKPSVLVLHDQIDRSEIKRLRQIENAEERCRQIHAELSNVIQKLRSNNTAHHKSQSIVERYGIYHSVLVRARQKYNHLGNQLGTHSHMKSDVHKRLGNLLSESRQLFANMEDNVNSINRRKENKSDAKRFKAYIATVLESNDPSTWMKNVTIAELSRNGGSPDPINRLYQLFIEGKGKYTLLFDAEMYKEASVRDDLFSTKQCKELAVRGEEVALREKREEEEAIAAEERRKKEEKEQAKMLKEIEMRHKWGMVGQHVKIQGLTSAKGKDMNNNFAHVLNYSVERDRFEVELHRTKEKALLKIDNMVVFYGYIPDVHAVSEQTAETTATTAPPVANPPAAALSATSSWASKDNKGVNKNTSPPRKVGNKTTHAVSSPKRTPSSPKRTPNGTDNSKMSKTIYVAASHSKRLTGKKGRKKKDLMERSGAAISVKTTIINNYVPVYLNGSAAAVWKAFALIQETVGVESVSEVEPAETSPPKSTSAGAARPPFCPTSTFQSIPAPEVDSNFGKFEKPQDKGFRGLSETPETEISSPQYSFGEVLLSKPSELPSEIGIKGLNMSKKSSNDGSVSSLNDRSTASRAPSISAVAKNDQMLSFLKTQQQCIKGSVNEFYSWLVKSEDIDSMTALKEAVADEEYLNENMKVGNGQSGVKGFKRKVFQRAVLDYEESPPQQVVEAYQSIIPPMENVALSGMDEMESRGSDRMSTLESAFLPSNLFGTPVFKDASQSVQSGGNGNVSKSNDPPPELICPIDLVLMTNDPVLAADGVTYERRAITNWFETNIAKIRKAQGALQVNPFSESDRRIVENGITSPTYGTKMTSLHLTENINVRNMARDFKSTQVVA